MLLKLSKPDPQDPDSCLEEIEDIDWHSVEPSPEMQLRREGYNREAMENADTESFRAAFQKKLDDARVRPGGLHF